MEFILCLSVLKRKVGVNPTWTRLHFHQEDSQYPLALSFYFVLNHILKTLTN